MVGQGPGREDGANEADAAPDPDEVDVGTAGATGDGTAGTTGGDSTAGATGGDSTAGATGGDGTAGDVPSAAEAQTPPLRFDEWRRRSATGAVMTGIALGLREALELPDQRPALVIEAPGGPGDPDRPIDLHFDPDDPSATVAVVRRPEGKVVRRPEGKSAAGQPDEDAPDSRR